MYLKKLKIALKVEDPRAANLQLFEKLFDYINNL